MYNIILYVLYYDVNGVYVLDMKICIYVYEAMYRYVCMRTCIYICV